MLTKELSERTQEYIKNMCNIYEITEEEIDIGCLNDMYDNAEKIITMFPDDDEFDEEIILGELLQCIEDLNKKEYTE